MALGTGIGSQGSKLICKFFIYLEGKTWSEAIVVCVSLGRWVGVCVRVCGVCVCV